jgi:phenylalanyl-tRNA synthetase beta chain
MPTIEFSLKDLNSLVGKDLTKKELEEYLWYCKAELNSLEGDNAKVEVADTNLPYLWSVEGIARLLKGVLSKEKGLAELDIKKSDYAIVVDKNVNKIRPYIAGFVAKGKKVDGFLLKQMIQLQEKLCENFGMRRKKVAIGIYSHDNIDFPVHYKAIKPSGIKFVPLGETKEMNLYEIIKKHPKGIEYGWILKDFEEYPILVDSKDAVLSFPPIINSKNTGQVEEGTENLFFEATGTDYESVILATNIFAFALADRGFEISSVNVQYPNKKVNTPFVFKNWVKINKKDVESIFGLDLKETEIKKLVESMRYGYVQGKVTIPCYRKDIMHKVDVIEDIGIAYGYDNIKEEPLTSYTVGESLPIVKFIDKIRDSLVGAGYQEVFSPILTSKEILGKRMGLEGSGILEIDNYMSETYSCVRNWLIPVLMEFLTKNKHNEYPQKIFEEGIVKFYKGNEIKEFERLALLSCSNKADFTDAKQALDVIMNSLGLKYEIKEIDHASFIDGRCGRIIVNCVKVGYIGEVKPEILENFSLDYPIAALELNITSLFKVIKK